MAVSADQLEEVLTSAGVAPEGAQSVVEALQQYVNEAVAAQTETAERAKPPSELVDSTEARLVRIEQQIIHLRELLTVRFEDVDRRFDEIDRRFGEIDRRFGDVDKRLDRERRERWGFVTAGAGAIVAGLLRLFGAI